MNRPKHLAAQGGGVWFIAHVGVWKALEELGFADGIDSLAGASAGGIFAALASLRYTADEMMALVNKTDFSKFLDGDIWQKVAGINKYGIHPGNYFLQFIRELIEAKTGSQASTFLDFQKAGYRDLTLYASNLNKCTIQRFSARDTPNTAVADGLRASMAVPGEFEAYEIDGEIYVDGGLCKNYPLDTWDTECPNEETIGCCFDISGGAPESGLKFGEYGKYVKAVFQTMLNSQYVALNDNPDTVRRSIVINTHGISALNFDVDNSDKQILFQSGRLAGFEKFK